jgi:hypothetical protein
MILQHYDIPLALVRVVAAQPLFCPSLLATTRRLQQK